MKQNIVGQCIVCVAVTDSPERNGQGRRSAHREAQEGPAVCGPAGPLGARAPQGSGLRKPDAVAVAGPRMRGLASTGLGS